MLFCPVGGGGDGGFIRIRAFVLPAGWGISHF